MTYPQAIRYLESLVNYEKFPPHSYKKSLKLGRMRGFLKLLGNPQDNLRCLHIAGTKGKGSSCAFAAYILKEAGFKVGLYTSPHLADFRERIRILQLQANKAARPPADEFEGMISKREIAILAERLKPDIEKYNRSSRYGHLTFFEVCTALTFLYFRDKRVDYAVLETGLGGRLDATNTVNPLVCGITPISYDHTAQLGRTLKKIAREKAGIIKNGRAPIVISAPQRKEAGEVIRNRCKEAGVRLREVGKDIVWKNRRPGNGFQIFDFQGARYHYRNFKIRLLGQHQLDNAALAIGMLEPLCNKKITPSALRRGLQKAVWPGRMELISARPRIVLDGAQNAASAQALKEALKGYFKYKNLILVMGISKDKDIKGTGDILCSVADKVILTKAVCPRAARPEHIQKILDTQAELTYNIPEAIRLARRLAGKPDLILVTGSLFVVGEARRLLKIERNL